MPIMDRLDPELAEVVLQLPVLDLTDLPAAREALGEFYAQINRAGMSPLVSSADHMAPGAPGQPDVMVRLFRPKDAEGVVPCLYWIQGGGYVLTAPDLDDQFCADIAERHKCAVVSVNWRRAPEAPFPAPAEDCYAGLAWTIRNALDLGIDPSRVVVGGASSGGGSAAGLALLVRDRGELSIAHQLLIYPMLDDTNSTPASHMVTDPQVWNRTSNEIGWRSYLGEAYGTDDVSPYAAPTRMQDLSELAPATVLTGELDLFVDEDVLYALRLMQAGVPTELHVYRAAHHGFDRMVPNAEVARRFMADRDAALRHAFTATQS
ncbi:alpha/beta hydrolase [Aeromicrobium sp.]|uniref:alpha/beta hydrolase fold domain-containing protein n=1 Tax=Aeromicrobium sp. TaxID=1871063 RepID=UPI0019AB994D|nr:alpha/beta hydrolase [Aeromicrobium sp.]MBC7630355.1 alpha/beta hydrolase [Aeromicrobium sp.]